MKYGINEKYFDEIDTPEKAYWLGFIYADGCLTKNSVRIGLAIKDECHLMLFLKCLDSDIPLYYYKSNFDSSVCLLQIGRKKIVNQLKKIGILERKTFSQQPILNNHKYELDFWRGAFDGDGCICYHLSKDKERIYPELSLTGNIQTVKAFDAFVFPLIGKHGRIEPHGNVFKIRWGRKKDAFLLSKLLYENSKINLNRKYELAKYVWVNYDAKSPFFNPKPSVY